MHHKIGVAAVADAYLEKARARAAEFGIPKAVSYEELLADADIGVVLNLTVPAAHAEVSLRALHAGKSVYGEKPLATTTADGRTLVETARDRGLALGSAPDTVLGAGIQTCLKLVRDGWIGRPIGASARFISGGPEEWHPDPRFLYKKGAGPLMDMGPYYLTALVTLLGPIQAVFCQSRSAHATRTIASGPLAGTEFPVETASRWESLIEWESGCTGAAVFSFDSPGASSCAPIELYGTAGTLQVPDPNYFGGPVRFRRRAEDPWVEFPLVEGPTDNLRGMGLAEMVRGLATGQPFRATGSVALHVLEVMEAMAVSSETNRRVAITAGPEGG
jgi:predicted dehydrogenase